MTTREAQLTLGTILQTIQNLGSQEFEELFDRLVALRAERLAPSIGEHEAALLQRIYQAQLSLPDQAQYKRLLDKLQSETISRDEQSQLTELHTLAEQLNAERLVAVSQLAALKHQSFDTVMHELGLLNSDVIAALED